MSNIVLTSNKRILGLPVKVSELQKGEQIVATNADMGMLFLEESDDIEILRDYSELDIDNLPEGLPISLPYIEDYKNAKIEELKAQIKEFESMTEDFT
jgi:hypothetical protein